MEAGSEGADRKRVAIACQGGGSHTAFTAGALKELLRATESSGYEIVGLSGTSGGAVCALLAWHAMLGGRDGAGERAARLLDEFWEENSAATPPEKLINYWTVWASKAQSYLAMPVVSPYDNPFAGVALGDFKEMLERRLDFGRVGLQPEGSYPVLIVGAVDVLSGEFKAFNSRHDRISADTVLASAAIPTLFRSVRVGGGAYWDGLFSQNPPVRELIDEGPDEIWVIQINPKERDTEPRTFAEIADRRNELAGNLSLHQELHFIEKIDQALEEGWIPENGKYRRIVVRLIELSRPRFSRFLGTASKLNRDPRFLQELMSHGEDQAREFLTALAFEDAWRKRDPDAVTSFFAEDAELVCSPPFQECGTYKGREQIRPFVAKHLCGNIRINLTKKQVARNRVAWAIRARRGDPATRVEGAAEAEFRDRKIRTFRLDPKL